MLEYEDIQPNKIAYDKPSKKLIGFLSKHYNLNHYIPQNNNFVVFDDYFNNNYNYKKTANNKYNERTNDKDTTTNINTNKNTNRNSNGYNKSNNSNNSNVEQSSYNITDTNGGKNLNLNLNGKSHAHADSNSINQNTSAGKNHTTFNLPNSNINLCSVPTSSNNSRPQSRKQSIDVENVNSLFKDNDYSYDFNTRVKKKLTYTDNKENLNHLEYNPSPYAYKNTDIISTSSRSIINNKDKNKSTNNRNKYIVINSLVLMKIL